MVCNYGCDWAWWCLKEAGGGYGVCFWKYIRAGRHLFRLQREKGLMFVFGLIGGAELGF